MLSEEPIDEETPPAVRPHAVPGGAVRPHASRWLSPETPQAPCAEWACDLRVSRLRATRSGTMQDHRVYSGTAFASHRRMTDELHSDRLTRRQDPAPSASYLVEIERFDADLQVDALAALMQSVGTELQLGTTPGHAIGDARQCDGLLLPPAPPRLRPAPSPPSSVAPLELSPSYNC